MKLQWPRSIILSIALAYLLTPVFYAVAAWDWLDDKLHRRPR